MLSEEDLKWELIIEGGILLETEKPTFWATREEEEEGGDQ